MATEALKSASITNLDTTPAVANTAGQGAKGRTKEVGDYVTTTTGVTSGSTYRIVRLKSTDVVKALIWESEAMGGSSAGDVGLYYSDAADGTPTALQGAVIDADFFASALSVVNAVNPTDIINESGVYTLDERNLPLWQAAGLSADPGGFFDVVFTSTATINTGARMGARAICAGE